ncbi:MAG TPA: hypothetical protein H9669_05975 [Firmicutes bacterium]|nr:hypothetical protein [Bacillota bacterium]
MIEQDTIKLLRECDAGIQMGVSAIDEVMDYVTNDSLKKQLEDCKNSHESLRKELEVLLDRYHDDGKSPNPMAKSMSWMKTKVDLFADPSDETVADLMTDGCNMGVKSLSRYLNQYQAADEPSKEIAKRLIALEERLAVNVRSYL